MPLLPSAETRYSIFSSKSAGSVSAPDDEGVPFQQRFGRHFADDAALLDSPIDGVVGPAVERAAVENRTEVRFGHTLVRKRGLGAERSRQTERCGEKERAKTVDRSAERVFYLFHSRGYRKFGAGSARLRNSLRTRRSSKCRPNRIYSRGACRLYLRVLDFRVELIDRYDLDGIVRRNEQVEVDRIVDGGLDDVEQRVAVDSLGAEIVVLHADLTLALDEILHFAVDENPADQVSLVGAAVVFERIREKVVYVDDAAVGVVPVVADIGVLPDDVLAVELEDVRSAC